MQTRYFIFEPKNNGTEIIKLSYPNNLTSKGWMTLASKWCVSDRDADWERDSLTMVKDGPTIVNMKVNKLLKNLKRSHDFEE